MSLTNRTVYSAVSNSQLSDPSYRVDYIQGTINDNSFYGFKAVGGCYTFEFYQGKIASFKAGFEVLNDGAKIPICQQMNDRYTPYGYSLITGNYANKNAPDFETINMQYYTYN